MINSQTVSSEASAVKGFAKTLNRYGIKPVFLVVFAVMALVPLFVKDEFILRLLISSLMFAGLAMAFDFTAGYINIVNFGFSAFWGLGAYVSGILVVNLHWPPFLTMLMGAAAAAVVGVMLGLLTIRLGGIFASCMTWFVALAMMSTAGNMVNLTRGHAGMSVPLLFSTVQNWPYYYVILIMVAAVYVIFTLIIRSHYGMAFRAIGQDVEAAASSGIDPVKFKVMNFTISCAVAGLFGGFYAHFIGILTPQVMHTSHTVEVLAMAYVGGRGTIWGPMLSAMIMVPAMEFLKDLMAYRLILYGALLIGVMILYPGGLAAGYEWFRNRKTQREGIVQECPAPDSKS